MEKNPNSERCRDTDQWFATEFCDPEITPHEAMYGIFSKPDTEFWSWGKRNVDKYTEPMDRRSKIGVPVAWRSAKFDVERHNERAEKEGREATLTAEQWSQIVGFYDGKCAYCDDVATVVEHVNPISLGGGTTADNVVPACQPCNALKKNLPPESWLKFCGITIEKFAAKHSKALS